MPQPYLDLQEAGKLATSFSRAGMLKEQVTTTFTYFETPESAPFFDLDGTGFQMHLQTARWRENRITTLENGGTEKEAIELSLEQADSDLRAFWLEFIARLPVLPIPLTFNRDKTEIIAPTFGNQRFLEMITPEERNGAIYSSMERVQEFLLKSDPGSVAVVTSPPGYSGLKDVNGQDIPPFKYSQTYVYRVDEFGDIDAITLVSQMNLEECEWLMESLGTYIPPIYSSIKRQEYLANQVATFLPDEKMSFEEILYRLQVSKQTPNMRESFSFQDTKNLIRLRDELMYMDQVSGALIEEYKEYVRENIHDLSEKNIEQMAEKLTKTILQMEAAMHQAQQREDDIEKMSRVKRMSEEEYYQAAAKLKTVSGCSGGGACALQIRRGVNGEIYIMVKKCKYCGVHINKFMTEGDRCPNDSCKKIFPGARKKLLS